MAASTTLVPDLTRYLVPADKLEYPEYAYRIKAADDTERRHLHQLISALLNSSGGVIEIDPGMPLDSKQFDQWQTRLKDLLIRFMPQHIYNQCISLCEESGTLFMMVRKSTVFITAESYMHTRGAESSTNYVGHWDYISAVINQEVVEVVPTIFPQNICYTYNDRCTVIESRNLEFKSYTCSTVDELIERLREPRTLKSLLGMANVSGGGEIVLGIKELPSGQGNVIVGQELDVSEEDDFKQKLAKLLKGDVNGIQRVWGDPTVIPSEGAHWECDILPIGSPPYHCQPRCKSCPHLKRRCLICIRVAQVCGGVYEKTPESFMVTDDGDVHMYEFSEWLERHRRGEPSTSQRQSLLSEKPITSTIKTAAAQASSSSGTSKQVSGIFEDDMQISFKEHSSHAELHRFKPEYPEHHIRQCNIFDMTRPLQCTPPAEDIEKFTNTPIMNQVNKMLGCEKGFGIACTSLYNCIKHDLTLSKKQNHGLDLKPQDHVLDLYTFTATAKAILFIICANFSPNKRALVAHGMILGRLLKRSILQNLSKSDKIPSLDFSCKFFDISRNSCHEVCPDFYGEWLKNTCEPDKVIAALGRVLTKLQTPFRDDVHHAAVTSLSDEQNTVLLAITRTRINVLEGPPGCGKTRLAQNICETKGKEKSAYISASKALNNRVRASGKVDTFLSKDSESIVSLLNKELKHKTHIVIDDNHSYQHINQTVAKICQQIITTDKYLYVFQDSKFQNYQNHKSSQFVIHLASNNYSNWTFTTMTEIQRNSQIVGSFIKAQVKNLHEDEILKCVSDIEGKDIQIKHTAKLRARSPENGLLAHIRDLISQPFIPGQWQCSYNDIAVLVDDSQGPREVAMFTKILEQYEPECKVQSAEVYPVEGTIVDLLKNFIGLESKVIVFIMSQSSPVSVLADQPWHTKQMIAVASRGIHRVDILQEDNLDKKLADRMKIDLYPAGTWKKVLQTGQDVKELWHLEKGKVIWDLCYIAVDGTRAILYISYPGARICVVSTNGEPLSVSVDSPGVRYPDCTASSRDGRRVVITGWDSGSGPHRCGVYEVRPGRVTRVSTWYTDSLVHSVIWTRDNDVIILLGELGPCDVARVSPTDGRVLWRLDSSVTHLRDGVCLSVNPRTDAILVCDTDCVRELSDQGQHIRDISLSSGVDPLALCVDSSGRLMFLGDGGRDIHLHNTSLGHTTTVIKAPGSVHNTRLHEDRYLGVATRDGIVMYDVSALF